jgi:hypothetical protein
MLTPEHTSENYRIYWSAILVVLTIQLVAFIALTIAVTNHSGLPTASTANAKANRSVIDDRSQLSKVSDKKLVTPSLRN